MMLDLTDKMEMMLDLTDKLQMMLDLVERDVKYNTGNAIFNLHTIRMMVRRMGEDEE